jgi:DHA1 family solute carrier family 18 vesicular amine transporter 1/2
MRRLVFLLYAFHFLVAADGNAVIPLVPTYTARFGLSVFDAGLIVAAPALAMLVLSLPVGLLSDRVGARAVTIAASALLTISALGQALAGSYAVLLASWTLFGVTSAIIYTASPAWLAASALPRHRVAVLGGIAIAAGLGLMLGPAFSGLLSEHFGSGTPFLVVAGAAAAVTVGLVLQPSTRAPAVTPVAGSLRALVREPHSASALGLMFFVGSFGGIVNLLVPLRLDEDGLGAGAIGIAFTASMALFVLTSGQVARLGDRVPLLDASGVATLALAVVLLIPVLAGSALPVIVFLVIRAPLWAVVSTISNPLSAHGAALAGVGTGFGLGLMNLCWAAGNLGGPLAGGALAGVVGDRPVFALLALTGAVIGIAVLRMHLRPLHDPVPVALSGDRFE